METYTLEQIVAVANKLGEDGTPLKDIFHSVDALKEMLKKEVTEKVTEKVTEAV